MNSRHRWLWIVLGLWLTLFQTAVAAHSVEEGIVPHHHGHCLLCHAGHLSGAAVASLPTLHVAAAICVDVVEPTPDAPVVRTLRRRLARGPPVC